MSVLDDFVGVLSGTGQQEVSALLNLILAKARRHTGAEAGSIFITRPTMGSPAELHAISLQNDRMEMDAERFSMPIDKTSIAGYVAATGEILEIDDLYELDPHAPYRFNRTYDDKMGYRSQSMLAFPLVNFHGRVIGVVQLLNHIKAVEGGQATYGPFPMDLVDDMKSIMTVLGAIVERADLVQEVARLKAKLGEGEAVQTAQQEAG